MGSRGSVAVSGVDGGLAPYLLVPSPDFLVRADGVDPTVLAPLADAGLTAYHAVRQHADLLDGNSVCVVIGVGGLGHLALQVLRELGCGTVLAADTRAAARDLAARLGADHVVDDVDRLRGTTRALGGADVVLDFVVSPDTVATAAELLASGGRLVMVGAGAVGWSPGRTVDCRPGGRCRLRSGGRGRGWWRWSGSPRRVGCGPRRRCTGWRTHSTCTPGCAVGTSVVARWWCRGRKRFGEEDVVKQLATELTSRAATTPTRSR